MEEMSGRFLRSGRELTLREYEDRKRLAREWSASDRVAKCQRSFFWLGRALRLPNEFDLSSMIKEADSEGSISFYGTPRVIEKTSGGERIIISPGPDLMLVQDRVNRLLQRTFPRPAHSFGYRGGTCLEVAKRHAGYPSTLKFDVRDAFFQVSWTKLWAVLRRQPFQPELRGFSGSIARWIARLCTYSPPPEEVLQRFPYMRSFLPQGAPTSPICFDLACAPLDAKLLRLAERVGGIVSRYADNYYFSMPKREISAKLERIVVCEAEKRGFPVHKVRRVSEGELCRILGYNLVNGRITNTRDFNRSLRGALHVLKTRLERGLEYEEAYARVRGFMGVAVNIPRQLQETLEHCEALREEAFERWATTIPF